MLRSCVRSIVEKVFDAQALAWSPWSPSAKRLAFVSTVKGIGNGEARVAAQLGGQVAGPSVSYDVLLPDGATWEVKEPTKGELRIEREGAIVVQGPLQAIRVVVGRLVTIFDPKAPESELVDRVFDQEQCQRIQDFLTKPDARGSSNAFAVAAGEIPGSRVAELRKALDVVVAGLSDKGPVAADVAAARDIETAARKHVALGSSKSTARSYEVDSDTAIDIAYRVVSFLNKRNSPNFFATLNDVAGDMGISTHAVVRNMFFRGLDPEVSRAFSDPDAFVRSCWTDAVKPSQMFGDVEGVVLVREDGFRLIPRDRLDAELFFKRISRGKPYLGVR